MEMIPRAYVSGVQGCPLLEVKMHSVMIRVESRRDQDFFHCIHRSRAGNCPVASDSPPVDCSTTTTEMSLARSKLTHGCMARRCRSRSSRATLCRQHVSRVQRSSELGQLVDLATFDKLSVSTKQPAYKRRIFPDPRRCATTTPPPRFECTPLPAAAQHPSQKPNRGCRARASKSWSMRTFHRRRC